MSWIKKLRSIIMEPKFLEDLWGVSESYTVVVSAIIIPICLCCMCISTYKVFTSDYDIQKKIIILWVLLYGLRAQHIV